MAHVAKVWEALGGPPGAQVAGRLALGSLTFLPQVGSYRYSVSQQDTGDPLAACPTSQVLARYSFRQEVSKHTPGIAEDGLVAIVMSLKGIGVPILHIRKPTQKLAC